MSTDVADFPTQTVKGPRLRFSLLTAFLLITLVSIGLGYAFRTRYCHATALFRVSSQQSSLWGGDGRRFDAREFEILKNTQVSLIKSHFVLQAALRNPGIASLAILAGKDDPVAWLAENIEADFPGDSEILEIRLRGNRVYDTDLPQIVDAVAAAYEKEVIQAEQQRRLRSRDVLARLLEKVREAWAEKLKDLQEIKSATGTDSAEVIVRQHATNTLGELVREHMHRLAIEDINASAPGETERIQKIQPAVITYE